tara:strand:- start:1021 stop:1230 length:210 start_codon:yes stop_codon:yes gene_type:complete
MLMMKPNVKAEVFFAITGKKRRLKKLIEFDGTDTGLIHSIEAMIHDEQLLHEHVDFYMIDEIRRLGSVE